jgi:hypothetical protein
VLDMTETGAALVDRPPPVCKVTEWKPRPGGVSTVIGHATISFAGGWVVAAIPIFRIDDDLSAGTPSAPELDREGRHRVDHAGKKQCRQIISFENAAARQRWNTAVLSALTAAGIWR